MRIVRDGLTLRDAVDTDVEAVVAPVEPACRGESSRTGWTAEADILAGRRADPEGVLAVVEPPDSCLPTVEREGAMVACRQLEHRGTSAHFGKSAVGPRPRGAGPGRTVIAEAERLTRRTWGVTQMRMNVISMREELIAWYVRRGHRRTGEMTPFPYGDERFGVPRHDGLQFELLVKPLA